MISYDTFAHNYSAGSIAMSFLEIGGLCGSLTSGYVTDKLVQKVLATR